MEKMVKLTHDPSYPIAIDNGWDTGDLHFSLVQDDKAWKAFIKQLEDAREKYMKKRAKHD